MHVRCKRNNFGQLNQCCCPLILPSPKLLNHVDSRIKPRSATKLVGVSVTDNNGVIMIRGYWHKECPCSSCEIYAPKFCDILCLLLYSMTICDKFTHAFILLIHFYMLIYFISLFISEDNLLTKLNVFSSAWLIQQRYSRGPGVRRPSISRPSVR